MRIEILGAESLGVRSLCCVVETNDRRIVIDPGVALGFSQNGLLPHPVQVAASERTRKRIGKALENATDVVISHYHGDHIPLVDANPYQLSVEQVAESLKHPKLWTKGTGDISPSQLQRATALNGRLGRSFVSAEGTVDGALSFSPAVPHGKTYGHGGNVMMTRIADGSGVFVHASDIQMLNDEAVAQILAWRPNIVLVSGPHLYLPSLTCEEQEDALHRTLQLARAVDILILDHHLLRSKEGERWLEYTSLLSENKITCVADFMGTPRNLLEAERVLWYKKVPVPDGWHEAYARGEQMDLISGTGEYNYQRQEIQD